MDNILTYEIFIGIRCDIMRGGSGESLISNYSARLPSFLRQDERTHSPNIAFTFTTCAHLWKCQTTCFYVTSKRLCFSHGKFNFECK